MTPSYKIIKLGRGKVAKVSVEDYENLAKYKWSLVWSKDRYYTYTTVDNKSILMHRMIMNPKSNELVDHINGLGLDNRRVNLRLATPQQNRWNSPDMYGKTGGTGLDEFVCTRKVKQKQVKISHREYHNKIYQDIKTKNWILEIDGIKTLFSYEDLFFIKSKTWRISSAGYVVAAKLKLHRCVMSAKDRTFTMNDLVDHKNRNRLDNSRINLRKATHSQNTINRVTSRGDMRNIIVNKNSFTVVLKCDGERIKCGNFKTLKEAKKARLEAQKLHHGDFRYKKA